MSQENKTELPWEASRKHSTDLLEPPAESLPEPESEGVPLEPTAAPRQPENPVPRRTQPPVAPAPSPKRRQRRSRANLWLLLILVVVAGMVCAALLLRFSGQSSGGKQKDAGFSDRSDITGGDDAWNYESEDKESTEALPAYTGTRKAVTLTLQSAAGRQELRYQELYEQCLPTTVSISVENRDGSGSGSGVVLTEDGYLITCAHVVEDQSAAEVTTHDGKTYSAQLVGLDAQTDLALLKIDATGLTPAQFGKTEELQVGDETLAIGDPLGAAFHGTLTNGILSGINRDVTLNGYAMTLLQTTAALNSGNSGGPLLNLYGQVIGINNMKMVSKSTTVEGLGFAVPSSVVKEIIETLAVDGGIRRPVLGISCYGLDEKAAAKAGLKAGLVVAKVDAKSDCAAKGLQVDDVITAVDGVPCYTVPQFKERIGDRTIGDSVTLTVSRPKTPISDQKTDGATSAPVADGSSADGAQEVTQVEYEDMGKMIVKLVDQQTLS